MRGNYTRSGGRGMFEQLESRRLMAGNVTAIFEGGTLVIVGDAKSNEINVEAGTSFQGYGITGLNGTTVNGQPDALIPTPGPSAVRIDLGNGEDAVRLFPAPGITFTATQVDVKTGNGNDTVTVDDWECNALFIDTGNGEDAVHVNNLTTIGGSLFVTLGNGSDLCSIGGSLNLAVDGLIDGGNGKDTLDATGLDLNTSNFLIFIPSIETLLEPPV